MDDSDNDFIDENDQEKLNEIFGGSQVMKLFSQRVTTKGKISVENFFEEDFIEEMKELFPSYDNFETLALLCREEGPSKLNLIHSLILKYWKRKISLPDLIQKLSVTLRTNRQLFTSLTKLISTVSQPKYKKNRNKQNEQKKQTWQSKSQPSKDGKEDEPTEEDLHEFLSKEEPDEEEFTLAVKYVYGKVPFDCEKAFKNEKALQHIKSKLMLYVANEEFRDAVGKETESAELEPLSMNAKGKASDYLPHAAIMLALWGSAEHAYELALLISNFSIKGSLILTAQLSQVIQVFMEFACEANQCSKSKEAPTLSVITETSVNVIARNFGASPALTKACKQIAVNPTAKALIEKLSDLLSAVFLDEAARSFVSRKPEKNEDREIKFASSIFGEPLVKLSLNKSGQKAKLQEYQIIDTSIPL